MRGVTDQAAAFLLEFESNQVQGTTLELKSSDRDSGLGLCEELLFT